VAKHIKHGVARRSSEGNISVARQQHHGRIAINAV